MGQPDRMFASVKVSPFGTHSRSIFDFIGVFGRQKLIEMFVELHYCMGEGRPSPATWAAIQKYSDEIDDQKRYFRKRWGIDENDGTAGQSGSEGKKQGV